MHFFSCVWVVPVSHLHLIVKLFQNEQNVQESLFHMSSWPNRAQSLTYAPNEREPMKNKTIFRFIIQQEGKKRGKEEEEASKTQSRDLVGKRRKGKGDGDDKQLVRRQAEQPRAAAKKAKAHRTGASPIRRGRSQGTRHPEAPPFLAQIHSIPRPPGQFRCRVDPSAHDSV